MGSEMKNRILGTQRRKESKLPRAGLQQPIRFEVSESDFRNTPNNKAEPQKFKSASPHPCNKH